MSKLDELETAAKASRLWRANPATVLAMVEVIRAATALRKRLEYPVTGVGLTERRLELLAFDAALAKLED